VTGNETSCEASSVAECNRHNGVADGFSQCNGYTHVVTVWRNFDVNTQYKIVNKQNGKALEVAGSSSAAGAAIQQRTFSGPSNQKWTITQTATGKYKVVNVSSGKALDLTGGSTAEGTALVQQSYSGTATQQWAFTSLADQAGSYTINPSGKTASAMWPVTGWTGDGDPMVVNAYNTNDAQKWMIVPL
jgi:hypothetical protein